MLDNGERPEEFCWACWGTSHGNPGPGPLGYVWAMDKAQAELKARNRWPQKFTDCERYDGVL